MMFNSAANAYVPGQQARQPQVSGDYHLHSSGCVALFIVRASRCFAESYMCLPSHGLGTFNSRESIVPT